MDALEKPLDCWASPRQQRPMGPASQSQNCPMAENLTALTHTAAAPPTKGFHGVGGCVGILT